MAVAHPCDSCPLHGRPQIRGEGPERGRSKHRPKKALAYLGEAPGRTEVRENRVFCGKAGSLLDLFLKQANISRSKCIITNALLCPIPDKDSLGPALIKNAISCCNRRRQMEGDLDGADFIVGVGGYAGYALTGHEGVVNVRGAIQQSAWGPCLVTYHPAYLLRGRKDTGTRVQADVFAQVVLDDFNHAVEYMRGGRGPKITTTIGPSPDQLRTAVNYILTTTGIYALDVEADSLDMMAANLNVLGIAYQTKEFVHSLVIPWWEGNYNPDELSRIRKYLARLFKSSRVTMVAHNAQYDTTLVERNVCSIDQPIRDTLIEHKALYPELRHDLQNVVTQYLLVEPWKFVFWSKERERQRLVKRVESARVRYRRSPTEKAEKTLREAEVAWDNAWAREPRELCEYNGKDAGYTIAVHSLLVEDMKRSKVSRVAMTDSRLGEITRRMTLDGIPLRVGSHQALSRTLKKRLRRVEDELRHLVGHPPKSDDREIKQSRRNLLKLDPKKFNPNSGDHKILLLDAYDVPCEAMTATGLRSTARRYLVEYKDNPAVAAILEYQDAKQILKTFVEGKGIVVDERGYLHPSWNAHALETRDPDKYGAVSGRWASSPNMQNWPKGVRNLIGFEKDDPRVIVQADYSQLELRILALLSGETRLIEAFMDESRDPHAENAALLFGERFTSLSPHSKEWDELRKMTKTSTYAWMYGAGVQVMHGTIKQDFPDITTKQVEFIRERFNEMCPSILDYREELLEEVSRTGQIRTLLLGRRRLFPLAGMVEPDASVIWNFPIQGTAADIIGLRVLKLYPHLPEDVTLISQIHDAILLVAMADKAKRVASLVKEHLELTLRYNGHTMAFPVEVKIGKTWGDT